MVDMFDMCHKELVSTNKGLKILFGWVVLSVHLFPLCHLHNLHFIGFGDQGFE